MTTAKSLGTSPYNTYACLKKADDILGPNRIWRQKQPISPTQFRWLAGYVFQYPQLDLIPEIQANATTDAQNHVDFLASHGWEAQITKVPADGFLTAAVLDVLVKWLKPGNPTTIKVYSVGDFPAVELDSKNVTYRRNKATGLITAGLKTQTADTVHIAIADKAPSTVLDLERMAKKAFDSECENDWKGNLIFPMTDLKSKQDLDWLIGLNTTNETTGKPFELTKAVQQATLKMNCEGARARAADEMGFRRVSMPPQPYVVDRPFLMAFKRPGLTDHLFRAYVDYDSWKDPGDLGT